MDIGYTIFRNNKPFLISSQYLDRRCIADTECLALRPMDDEGKPIQTKLLETSGNGNEKEVTRRCVYTCPSGYAAQNETEKRTLFKQNPKDETWKCEKCNGSCPKGWYLGRSLMIG